MGKSKKKVVDLKPEKVSEKQLSELQQVVSAVNKLQFDVGAMEARKHNTLHALFQGTDKLSALQTALTDEYGTNDIDIQTGAINYVSDDGSPNS
jgi:hypothetical protein